MYRSAYRVPHRSFRNLVGVAIVAAVLASAASQAERVYHIDSTGAVKSFDSTAPPAWAAMRAEQATQRKINEITFNVIYKDQTARWGLGNNTGFDHPTLGMERRAVVDRVLEYLGDVLNESGPSECDIQFDTSETDGSGFLATAGPLFFEEPHGFGNGLAFQHITTGIDPSPDTADIVCRVDFGFPWYTDAAPQVPENRLDLFTALLHELTHGLGLLSVCNEDGGSLLTGGNPGVYTRWDESMSTGGGSFVFNASTAFLGPVESLIGSDGGILLRGATVENVFGGGVPLYTPETFVVGSSLSHLSLDVPGTHLMKPVLDTGVAIREYSQLEVALLRDIGYVKASTPGSPSAGFASSSFSIGETNGTAVIAVELSEPPGVGNTASVRYVARSGTASEGADFIRVSGAIEFGPFDAMKTFLVPIVDDGFRESSEVITLKLRKPKGMTLPKSDRSATLTIIDDDLLPQAAFESTSVSVSEGSGPVQIQVNLTAPNAIAGASVTCVGISGSALSGFDFGTLNGVFEFDVLASALTITIPVFDDTRHEGLETFSLELLSPNGVILSPDAQVITIIIEDDDVDSDGDGLSDSDESSGAFGYVTNPHARDTDGDWISDRDEIAGTFGVPTNPTVLDTDGDGAGDGAEVFAGSDPTDPDSASMVPAIAVPRFSSPVDSP